MNRPALCVAIVVSLLSACTLSTVELAFGVVDLILQHKTALQNIARIIKLSPAARSIRGERAQEQYSDAKNAYDRYLDIVIEAVIDGHTNKDLTPYVERIVTTTEAFVSTARVMGEGQQRVETLQLRQLPTRVPQGLLALPKQRRTEIVSEIEQLKWKSWDDL